MQNNKLVWIALVIFVVSSILTISMVFFECTNNVALDDILLYSISIFVITFLLLFVISKKLLKPQENTESVVSINKNYFDDLTNLPNRTKFFQDLEDAKGIVLLDLDDFSILNIIYSKDFGDEFLKKLSHKLVESNCIDNLYRMGGDEFAYISKDEKDLKTIAECLHNVVDNFYIIKDNVMVQLSATIAISYKPPFIETVDLALKYGKKHKLNLVTFSNSLDVFDENKMFVDVTMRVKKALKNNNIVPFFQCIKDKNEKTVKYEALIRIKEGEKYLLPAVFLDIAKQTKLYPDLTIQMLNKTFEYFNYLNNKDISFSLNLSYDDILNKRVYDYLFELIDNYAYKENITIELLETENIQSFDYVKNFIDELHKRGAKIAIDDFGSGYSNFVYLEKLDVDIIKIDGSIVSEILSSDNAMFLVRTIVEFCKKNNIVSVAEFVSHREIFMALKELDVDEYQGFYFCKPKENIDE